MILNYTVYIGSLSVRMKLLSKFSVLTSDPCVQIHPIYGIITVDVIIMHFIILNMIVNNFFVNRVMGLIMLKFS